MNTLAQQLLRGPGEFVDDSSGKALLIKPKWAGAIDTTGGNILHTLLKGCMLEGNVVSTGLVSSPKLDATVYPFILNGINLLGVGTRRNTNGYQNSFMEKAGE